MPDGLHPNGNGAAPGWADPELEPLMARLRAVPPWRPDALWMAYTKARLLRAYDDRFAA